MSDKTGRMFDDMYEVQYVKKLEQRIKQLEELVKAKDELLLCRAVGTTPPKELFERIKALEEK